MTIATIAAATGSFWGRLARRAAATRAVPCPDPRLREDVGLPPVREARPALSPLVMAWLR